MAEENAGAGSGFMGMFNAYVDPQGLSKRVPDKLFWLWPLITVILIFIVFGYLMVPYTLQLVDAQMAQRNIPPESLERARNIGHMFGQASVFITPVFVVLLLMLIPSCSNINANIAHLNS
jgi:uncharacterized membrane protein YhaH (DUF805 family)